ncbi:Hypothetical protein, putative [Bodo saltans]|uniref:Uncharacterized protein n=1 Tax=Bodo saltans TaxID=75058 RepID=A0A0S4KIG8_BODSA|nr:Hypothetical protein, putative [Bodo saltans]|eukprot:CUI15475.1 Hypothetical protein, putative [Bodo saltans]
MATSTIAESYMAIILELLRDAIDPSKWAAGSSGSTGSHHHPSSSNASSSTQQQQQATGGSSTTASTASSHQNSSSSNHPVGNAGGASLDPPEEYLSSVLRRYEPRITNLFRDELSSLMPNLVTDVAAQLHRSGIDERDESELTAALTRRLHAAKVLDIILAVRGGVSQYILSGGNANSSNSLNNNSMDHFLLLEPSSSSVKMSQQSVDGFGVDVRSSRGNTTVSSGSPTDLGSNNNEPSLVSAVVNSVFRSSGLLRLFLDQGAARRCCALLDIVWMQSVFIVLGGIVETERVSAYVASPTSSSAAPLPTPHSMSSASPDLSRHPNLTPVNSPSKEFGGLPQQQSSPNREQGSTAPVPTINDLAYVPVVYFLRRQHISDIENLICTWILRDVDVYPTYRRWIQHWSLELLSMVCGVDSSVAHASIVGVQHAVSTRYAAIEKGELVSSNSSTPSAATTSRRRIMIPLDSVLQLIARESQIVPTSPLLATGRTTATMTSSSGDSDAPSNYPVILTPPLTFVEKYIKGLLSIVGDLSVYKNYSGLLKYVRIVSSWRVASNALLITLTSILVELAAAAKGKKEVKAIFAEFCTRLLVPVAHTPHHRVDGWVFRNCEFLHMRHLNEWVGKTKYAPVAIPAIAAILGCCSIPFLVRQTIPFCQLVAKSLPDADRRMRGSYLFALQHVVGICFRQVLTHHKLGTDAVGLALRKDLFNILQTDIAANLRRTPLTQQSTKAVEAATELFILTAQCFPIEGLTILVELLPALDGTASGSGNTSSASARDMSSLLFSEATAVSLNALGALSDAMFSADAAGSKQQPMHDAHPRGHGGVSTPPPPPASSQFPQPLLPQFRLAFQVWGGVDTSTIVPPKVLVDEDLLAGGILTFPTSPFCTIRRQPSTSGVMSTPLAIYGSFDGGARSIDTSSSLSSHASLFYSSREHRTASWGAHQFHQAASSNGSRSVPSISIFAEHGWDDELDAACRKVGTSFLNWGVVLDPEQQLEASMNTSATPDKMGLDPPSSTIGIGRDFLNSKENFLLKRLTAVLAALRDLLSVPQALRTAMKQQSVDSVNTAAAAASMASFASTLSEKEKMAQRLLIATFLVSRYWAPTSAFLSEIPRALLHWNHSLVLATSAVVLPHFFVHRSFHHFVQPIIARFVEVVAVSQDDREATMTLAKSIANMSSLLRCTCVDERLKNHHSLQHHRTHSSSLIRRVYEPFVKWLLQTPSLPSAYYFAAPTVASVSAVEMQAMSPMDLLDGVGLVLLGNNDPSTRQAALAVLSDVVRITDTMKQWKEAAAATSIPSQGNATQSPSSSTTTAALLVDWSSYCCVGHSLMGSYGVDTIEECIRQIDDCRFVGCNWSDESTKNLKLVSTGSCYSPSLSAVTTKHFLHRRQAKGNHPLVGTPRLLFSHAQDVLRFHVVTDSTTPLGDDQAETSTVFSNIGAAMADILRPSVAPLPFVFVANIALDFVARAVSYSSAHGSTTSSSVIGVTRAPLVAAKLASYVFIHVATGSSSSSSSAGNTLVALESKYAVDTWRSAYCLYYTLLICEAHPARRVLFNGSHNNTAKPPPTNDGGDSMMGWLIPDKARRLPELLQLTLVTLQRFSGLQDVFDVVSFMSSVIVQRVLNSSLKDVVVLTSDYSRLHIDFVKKFLDDPVKSLARKDKKRALAYCAIACPTLLAAAISITSPLPVTSQQQLSSPNVAPLPAAAPSAAAILLTTRLQEGGGVTSLRLPSPQSSSSSLHHHHHDIQLQAVKLFDAFDVLVSVLITGNFSSTVAGSNAPTSSSSVTFTPQQHELLKSGGVSSLAALSPIPSAQFVVAQRPIGESVSSHRRHEGGTTDDAFSDVVATYHSETPWPLSSVSIDEIRGAPVLHSVAWSSSSAATVPSTPRGSKTSSSGPPSNHVIVATPPITLDQSFSVRLRASLIEMLGVFYQHEMLLLPFLRERHRAMEEFLLFNVIGTPSRNMTRALMDSQSLMDRMEIGFSVRHSELWETSAAIKLSNMISRRQKALLPIRVGDPPHAFVAALRHLMTVVGFSVCGGSGPSDPQQQQHRSLNNSSTAPGKSGPPAPTVSNRNVPGGLQLLTRLLDGVLDTYLSNLGAWSKVTSTPPLTSSHYYNPTFPFPSCFSTESPFRECLVRVSSEAVWSGQALRMLHHRLQDTNVGSAEYLFFSEALICFLNANPALILASQAATSGGPGEDDLSQSSKRESINTTIAPHAHGTVRRKVHGHQLFRDEPAPPPTPLAYLESPRGPSVFVTCLLVVGAVEAGVNDTLWHAADDLLRTIHRAVATTVTFLHHHDTSSSSRGDDSSAFLAGGADKMQQWIQALLQQYHALYHMSRQRNQYNRMIEVLLHRLQSHRIVRTPTWIGAHFAILAPLLAAAELNEDTFRALVIVCRLHRADIGDECLGGVFAALDQSTPENQSRIALYIMKLDDPEDLRFVLSCIRRYYSPVSTSSQGAPPADALIAHEPNSNIGRRGSFTKNSEGAGRQNLNFGAQHQNPHTAPPPPQRSVGQGIAFTLFCHSLKQLIQLRTLSWCKPTGSSNALVAAASGASSHFSPSASISISLPPAASTTNVKNAAQPTSSSSSSSSIQRRTFVMNEECIWSNYAAPSNQPQRDNSHGSRGSSNNPSPKVGTLTPQQSAAETEAMLSIVLSQDANIQDAFFSSIDHLHDLTATQRHLIDSLQADVQKLRRSQSRSHAQVVLERAKRGLFIAQTSPDAESWLHKPLRAVFTCFSFVSEIISKQRSLLCDAAAELGMGERVARHLFMRERKVGLFGGSKVAAVVSPTLSQHDGIEHHRKDTHFSVGLDSPGLESLPPSSITPPALSPSKKMSPAAKQQRVAAILRSTTAVLKSGDVSPRSSSAPQPSSLAFPFYPSMEEDEESFMSNTSQATFLVHDDVTNPDHLLAPALHSSISGFTQADEASMASRALGASRRSGVAPKEWIVDEAALSRELLALVSETMLLCTTHVTDLLLSSYFSCKRHTLTDPTCVQCTRRKQLEGACIVTSVRSLKSIVALWHDAQLVRAASRKDDDDEDHADHLLNFVLHPTTTTFSLSQSIEMLAHVEDQMSMLMERKEFCAHPHSNQTRAQVNNNNSSGSLSSDASSRMMQLISAALPLPIMKMRLRECLDYVQHRLPDVLQTIHCTTQVDEGDGVSSSKANPALVVVAVAMEARYASYYLQSVVSQFTALSKSSRIAQNISENAAANSSTAAGDEHERRGVSVFLLAPLFRGVLSLCCTIDAIIHRQLSSAEHHTTPTVRFSFAFLSDALHSALSSMFRSIDPPSTSTTPANASALLLQNSERILSETEVIEFLWTSIATVVCGAGVDATDNSTRQRLSTADRNQRPSASSSALWWTILNKISTFATLVQRGCLASGLSVSVLPRALASVSVDSEGDTSNQKHSSTAAAAVHCGLSPMYLNTLRRMTPECLFVIGTIARTVSGAETLYPSPAASETLLDLAAERLRLDNLVETVSNLHPKVAPFLSSLFWLMFPFSSDAHVLQHSMKENSSSSPTPSEFSSFLNALRMLCGSSQLLSPHADSIPAAFGSRFIALSTSVFGATIDHLFNSIGNERQRLQIVLPTAVASSPARWAISPPEAHLETNKGAGAHLSSSSIADGIMDDFKERLSMFLVTPVIWLVCRTSKAAGTDAFNRALQSLDAILTNPRLRTVVMSLLDERVIARLFEALIAARRVNSIAGGSDGGGRAAHAHSTSSVCSRLLSLLACWGNNDGSNVNTINNGNCTNVTTDVLALFDHMFDNAEIAGVILLPPPAPLSQLQVDPLSRSVNPSPLDGAEDDEALVALLGGNDVGWRDEPPPSRSGVEKKNSNVALKTNGGAATVLASSAASISVAVGTRNTLQVDWWPDFPTNTLDAVLAIDDNNHNNEGDELFSPARVPDDVRRLSAPKPPFGMETSFLLTPKQVHPPADSQKKHPQQVARPTTEEEAHIRPLYVFAQPYYFTEGDDEPEDFVGTYSMLQPRIERSRFVAPELMEYYRAKPSQQAGKAPVLPSLPDLPAKARDDDVDSLQSLQSEEDE